MEEIRSEALLEIPDDLNLTSLSGLSNECKEVLVQSKPGNVSLCVYIHFYYINHLPHVKVIVSILSKE